jgi:amino acid adenylation domain-containing protein
MLIQKFEEQVKKTPAGIAVKTEKRSYTYDELNRYANRIAGLIDRHWPKNAARQEHDHKESGNICLFLEHGVDMIAAVLGTLKAGKAYVPLSPDYPKKRVSYIVNHSEAALLITNCTNEKKAGEIAAGNNIPLLNIDQTHESEVPFREDTDREISGEKLAYIMYTSGSTGKPKGVIQNHENVLYYIKNWTQRFSITHLDRMTLFSSFCHDGSGQDMFGALLNGATLYPYDVRNRESDVSLSRFLLEEEITIWHSVPSLYNFFVKTLTGKEHFDSLRYILLGGEPFRGYEIEMFKKHFPQTILANVYGQTESSVDSIWTIAASDTIKRLIIGQPLDNTRIFVIDGEGNEVEPLETGEILIACPHITPGYWRDDETTKKTFGQDPGIGRLYYTGDLGRLLPDGNIEFMGRKDFQVKIRGFRVEIGEIETSLLQMGNIKEAVVVPKETGSSATYLCTFITAEKEMDVKELREFLSRELPDYMIPTSFVQMDKMPLTQSGKIDRKALSQLDQEPKKLNVTYVAPQSDMERIAADTWKEVLHLEEIGINDNFFDLGGNSFDIIKINNKLRERLNREIPMVKMFEFPTIGALANYLHQQETGIVGERPVLQRVKKINGRVPGIAVIGMAGRFPGAKNIHEFWDNIKNGVESISFFSTPEIEQGGVDGQSLQDADYVKARGVLADIEYFDAAFFNYSPNEAEMMDPQLRLLHECSWEALENAGYDPGNYDGFIGLYAGNAPNQYWVALTYINQKSGLDTVFLNNNYSTKVSYKLNLKGPSVNIQTACSTSLVAIHFACQGLINGECDMALAGGVSISLPDREGYLYREGMIFSPDGHCRAFAANAGGTVFGNGVGIVVLKRLPDAIVDGDTINAIIKGTAINNDGNRKVGITAPSVEGQAESIAAAREMAGAAPESIGYIETHGTGTLLGDPVEIEALKLAFYTDKKQYCAIGSVKTNVGHLNSAAGAAGFIKAVLALKYKTIPPSLHFEIVNPKIDFENSPFYVNTELKEWKSNGNSLRAGVSSFGIGGTNAHVILEEFSEGTGGLAPLSEEELPGQGRGGVSPPGQLGEYQLILLSAKTPTALDKMTINLVNYLKENPGLTLADAAYTLQVGRAGFPHRKMAVCSTIDETIEALSSPESGKVHTSRAKEEELPIIFMFSGQGAQYVNMGSDLYKTEPIFRQEIERCFEILKPLMDYDIKKILYPHPDCRGGSPAPPSPGNSPLERGAPQGRGVSPDINQTEIAQPILFVFEYALAKLLITWGIKPYAMIGHSIGEYAAACLSGVFSLEDALKLVVLRGKLMQKLPEGAMLSVPLPEKKLTDLLTDNISLAAVNSSSHCVVSGPHEAIHAFAEKLKEKGCETRNLHTSHAFHSQMMEPILPEFEENVRKVALYPPKIPYISNVSGKWISVEEAADPKYWAGHLRQTVRFGDGLTELLKKDPAIFVEVGPAQNLSIFVRQHLHKKPGQQVINLIRHPKDEVSDTWHLLNQIGHLWLYGKNIDGTGFHGEEKRHRIPLPTYPFETQHFWLAGDPLKMGKQQVVSVRTPGAGKKAAVSEWFYAPLWKPSPIKERQIADIQDQTKSNWLLLVNKGNLGDQLVQRLEHDHSEIIMTIVKIGAGFTRPVNGEGEYTINPRQDNDYHALFEELHSLDKIPGKIIHLWTISEEGEKADHGIDIEDLGFYSLLAIVQAIGKQGLSKGDGNETEIIVLTNRMQAVTGEEVLEPQKAAICGAVQVISREYAKINCRTIDIDGLESTAPGQAPLMENLLAEIAVEIRGGHPDMHVAYRNNQRWIRTFEQIHLPITGEQVPVLKERGVYLVTGGLGGIGLVLAEYLAKTYRARLILLGRSAFPQPAEWENWLNSHDAADSVSHKIRKIRELEASGAEVLVLNADVANMEQVQDVVTRSEERFGKINGIIHCAGVPDGALIQRRTREISGRVFAAKIRGTLVLDAIFNSRELDFFVLCSSISSILAPLGQAAYCAANAFLDAYAHYKTSRESTYTVSINWDNWQEVGMAAKAAAPFNPPPVQRTKIDHPLFDYSETYGFVQERLISNLHTNKHWVLDEHRIMEEAALPGTAYLEMARAAVASHSDNGVIELKEVFFLNPLVVKENETKEIHTLLQKESEGYTFSIISRLNPGEDRWVEHARGKAAVMKTGKPTQYDLREIEERCSSQEIVHNPDTHKGQQRAIRFGPRWNSLKHTKFGNNQALALLELSEAFADDIGLYQFHPALVDVATTFLHGTRKNNGAYLPFYYKKIRIRNPLPGNIYCCARAVDEKVNAADHKSPKEILKYDITIMDEQGLELVEIEEFTLKSVNVDVPGIKPVHEDGEDRNFSLVISSPGNFDNLTFQPAPRSKPGPGEVEIAVYATGVNFKEVLLALGALGPIKPDFAFGLECSGKITACGEGVEGFAVGDDVFAFGASGFSPYIITPAAMAAHKPVNLSFEETATIPIAFMTAYYALVKLAQLKKGERILIHSAAGGVGMAAVKIAQWKGAEIYATAGNQEKRSYLHSLGIQHIMDSRSLDFADEVMKRTDGKGVHVVLNSLSGEFIAKSLSLLAPYGRFIEIGMRDLLNNTSLGLRPFLKGLSYFSLFLAADLPDIESVWHEVAQHFQEGTFTPLPYQTFSIDQVPQAFEYMTRGEHIGKIVVVRGEKEEVKIHRQQQDKVARPYNFFFSPGSDRDSRETPLRESPPGTLKHGILPGEGVDVFKRILGKKTLPQVVVSTTGLFDRIKKSRGPDEAWLTEELPGKTVPGLKHARPELSVPYVAPGNETEQILANIWQELLGIQQVGIHDDFFELGGDSLKAVNLVSRIRKELGIDIPIFTMFSYQTIRAFTQSLVKGKRNQQFSNKEDNQSQLLDKSSQKMKKSIQRLKNKR